MLRVVPHKSAAAARHYYTEGLKREDYYTKGEEVPGQWHGKAAALLGLSGPVERHDFTALVENRHPTTGKRLTPRTKVDRLVGYDMTFNAPKSLSVLYALTQDKSLLHAFRSAVAATMSEIEGEMATRVRQGGRVADRITGNMAWAEFVHFTARPVGGIPDPHLHCHGFAVNLTFDAVEDRWKAAKFREIKKNARYSEAVFHSHLTGALAALGYGIDRTRTGWEIQGVPASVIAKFSRRTHQIDELAEKRGIRDAKLKDALGAVSREGKRHGLAWSDLLAAWSVRLTEEEKLALSKVCYEKGHAPTRRITAAEAVTYAVDKSFAKNSVVLANTLLGEAMRVGVGQLSPEAIRKEMLRHDLLVREVKGDLLCTSLEALAEEVALISYVRGGRGRMAPLALGHTISPHFSAEQQRAARRILESRDQVVGLQGRSGAGKTTLMKELVTAIEMSGKRVYAFAPSASASRDSLREAGFENAETVAHLMVNKTLLAKTRGQVVIIDEAGMLGVPDLWRALEAFGPSTRVILTGDTKQHAPVARGDAFRILQDYSGMAVAEVTEIRRQEVELYRKAIESLSKGDLRAGFRRLDELGAFIEIADEVERYRALAADYLSLSQGGAPPLVVSPTHREGANVTQAIRQAKREANLLGPERELLQLHNLQWEEADRSLPENYSPGLVVQFRQNAKGIRRGDQFRISERLADGTVRMTNSKGDERILNLKEADRFEIYEERKIALAKGDVIRITKNGDTDDGRRISNGNIFSVAGFDRKGRIQLHTGGVLSADHGHLTYGYCLTSHTAQGKSVKDVLVAQAEDSFLASSAAQFYVSASRAKQSIRIYTDSRSGLQHAVGNSASRMSALELAQFSRPEINDMSDALNRDRWRDALRQRRNPAWQENVKTRAGVEKTKTFVQNVVEERRGKTAKKGEVVSWKAYVEMKRSMAGPDGKSRSKGHPSPPGKKGRVNGALIKRSEHSTPVRDQMLAAHAAKKAEGSGKAITPPAANDNRKKSGRPTISRIKVAAKSSAENFKAVVSRGGRKTPEKGPEEVAKRVSKNAGDAPKQHAANKSQNDRTAERRLRQKRQDAVQKPPAPVKNITPVVRKGR